jgi:hypothetical protein
MPWLAALLQEGVDAADHVVEIVHAAAQVGIVHASNTAARRSRCRRRRSRRL